MKIKQITENQSPAPEEPTYKWDTLTPLEQLYLKIFKRKWAATWDQMDLQFRKDTVEGMLRGPGNVIKQELAKGDIGTLVIKAKKAGIPLEHPYP